MGGWGSGRRWASRQTTADYLALDVRRLQRTGVLERRYLFNWQWTRDGERVGYIGICPEPNCVILKYRHESRAEGRTDHEYAVPLEWTRCHYGGERAWFRCPAKDCGRRVAILYGGTIFACRHCYRLAYPCQRESPGDRADSRAWKIRQRCGGWGCLLDPVLRPKGMHRQTFRRLEKAYERACRASEWAFAARVGMSMEEAFRLAR